MRTTTARSHEQGIWKSPWEAHEVRADGPTLLSDEKSGEPFLSFICEGIWKLWASEPAHKFIRVSELWNVMYPARRGCTPCWAVPTDVRNMLHIGRMTDLHLMLLDHWKEATWKLSDLLGNRHNSIHNSFLIIYENTSKSHTCWQYWLHTEDLGDDFEALEYAFHLVRHWLTWTITGPSGQKFKESAKCLSNMVLASFKTAFVSTRFLFPQNKRAIYWLGNAYLKVEDGCADTLAECVSMDYATVPSPPILSPLWHQQQPREVCICRYLYRLHLHQEWNKETRRVCFYDCNRSL